MPNMLEVPTMRFSLLIVKLTIMVQQVIDMRRGVDLLLARKIEPSLSN